MPRRSGIARPEARTYIQRQAPARHLSASWAQHKNEATSPVVAALAFLARRRKAQLEDVGDHHTR
jgi:hypothetical protein